MSLVYTSPAVDLTVLDPALARLVRASHHLIAGLQTPEGAYPASPTFSAYEGYCWFRDGAFIADAMSVYGDDGSANAFFDWCARVIGDRRDHIRSIVDQTREGKPPAGERMLPARFTFAGGDGTDEWWDFQLDGYGTWLWALVQHLGRSDVDADRWRSAVELTVDYLLASWSRPCYDWWEEHSEVVHVSTLACVAAGLQAVADAGLVDRSRAAIIDATVHDIRDQIDDRGIHDGHLVKWLDVDTVDGSLAAAIAPLGLIDAESDVARRTIAIIERHLTVDGGVHRYLGDTFYGGGQWPLLSCFLGLAHAAAGDRGRAAELLAWRRQRRTRSLRSPSRSTIT